FASLLVVLLIVILPMSLLAATIVEEASLVIQKMRSGEFSLAAYFQRALEALPAWAQAILERLGFGELDAVQQKLLASAGQSGQAITPRVFSIGQNTLDFTVSFFVMVYVLFFLFRDGASLTRGIARTIPLRPHHTQRLLQQFATV